MRFKPSHAAHPVGCRGIAAACVALFSRRQRYRCGQEDALTPEQILQLPPEIRELRSFAPPGQIKAIVEATNLRQKEESPALLQLSEPDGAPVTEAELTPQPYARATPEDYQVMDEMLIGPPPTLPPVPGGLTDAERYLLDTHGYVRALTFC